MSEKFLYEFECAAGSLGLPVTVIVALAGFGLHAGSATAFQAGLKYCSSNASAAS